MSGYAEWNAVTAYAVNDIVTFNGVIYIALQNSLNRVPPSSPTFWSASGGTTAGVSSLNALTGAVSVASLSSGLTVGTSGNTVTLALSAGGPSVTSLNSQSGPVNLASAGGSVAITTSVPGVINLETATLPPALVFTDSISFPAASLVLFSPNSFIPDATGNYLITWTTSILSAPGGPIAMNSQAGDQIIALFVKVPPGFDTQTVQSTYSVAQPVPVVGQTNFCTNVGTTVQALTVGVAYRLEVNTYTPSGTANWDPSSNTTIKIIGPI